MVRPGLLIGVVLLAACVGCFPKAEQLRPDAVWDRLRGANPPEEPLLASHGNAEIWVLGPSQLPEWLLAHRWVPKPRR